MIRLYELKCKQWGEHNIYNNILAALHKVTDAVFGKNVATREHHGGVGFGRLFFGYRARESGMISVLIWDRDLNL